jgi:hypothetical protein
MNLRVVLETNAVYNRDSNVLQDRAKSELLDALVEPERIMQR